MFDGIFQPQGAGPHTYSHICVTKAVMLDNMCFNINNGTEANF